MAYEDLFPYLGDFGRYQKRIYFLLCLTAITCGFHKLAGVFLLARPAHRCQLPFELSNATYELPKEILPKAFPYDTLKDKWSECERYDANYTDEYFASNTIATKVITCDNHIFNTSKHKISAVTEWDMVCSRAILPATADALFMVGVLIGSLVFGQMSDKYGRKPIFFASLILQVVFGVLVGVSPNYISYAITRLIVGATTSGTFLVSYVIAMEMVGPKARLFAGVAVQMFFTTGYILVAPFAYYLPNWRHLQIALTLPGTAFFCYYFFIPESARWLISKNRTQEAIRIIKAAAKENKVTIPQSVLGNITEEQKEVKDPNEREASLIDLFRHANLRKKTLLIFFDWFVNSGTYYGLSWNTNNLGGNDILNFVIAGAVEYPAYTFLLFTLNKWGRRNILCGAMATAGLMLILTIAVPKDMHWLTVTLAMLGKLAITSSYGTIYIFTAEQFPTPVRNVGLGASSMVARFGGILAPYIIGLSTYWTPFPMIIFGVLALTGGLLSWYLPETLNKKLPETIEEGERFGKKGYKHEEEMVNAEELKNLNNPHHPEKNENNGVVKT